MMCNCELTGCMNIFEQVTLLCMFDQLFVVDCRQCLKIGYVIITSVIYILVSHLQLGSTLV